MCLRTEEKIYQAVVVQKYSDRKAVRLSVNGVHGPVELSLEPPYWLEQREPNERDILIIKGIVWVKGRRKKKWMAQSASFPLTERGIEEIAESDPRVSHFRKILALCAGQADPSFPYIPPEPRIDFRINGLNRFLQLQSPEKRKEYVVALFGVWVESSARQDGRAEEHFGEAFYRRNHQRELFMVFSPVQGTISVFFYPNPDEHGRSQLFFEISGTITQITFFLNEFLKIAQFRASSVKCSNGAVVYSRPERRT